MTSPSSSTKRVKINGIKIKIQEKIIKYLPINKKSKIHSARKQTEEPCFRTTENAEETGASTNRRGPPQFSVHVKNTFVITQNNMIYAHRHKK
jgi:hypothetical protein